MSSKSLVLSLLRIVQADQDRISFHGSTLLKKFVTDSGIGTLQSDKVVFYQVQKERIRAWLISDGIDPSTPPQTWAELGRSEALDVGPDEKWAGKAVRENRIALKTLAGKPLLLCSAPIELPLRANLECDVKFALQSIRHESVILVENWEAFECVDELRIDMGRAGNNPLVVWRGGGPSWSVGAAQRFLKDYMRPVWSAPDYDPAGLAIALRLPYLEGVLAPSDEVLVNLLAQSRLRSRFLDQLTATEKILDQASNLDIQRLWKLVKRGGTALPQERLIIKA